MNVLVLNAGSSSLKFHLFESERAFTGGEIERVSSMRDALTSAFDRIGTPKIDAVGHRVVHGGDLFHDAALIDDKVERQIEELSALAPLHNPHNLEAIRAARQHLPNAPQVAVFDTAFHLTLPPRAYLYGLPYKYLTEKKIRRYGFHGISHRYVAARYAELQQKPVERFRMITCHLGNGCSICAIANGRSIDTSMGFTPLEGLIMGTRSGDVDPGALLHLITHDKIAPEDLIHTLNIASGLKGLSGLANDMRDLEREAAKGNERATLAIDAFCYRVRKYIGMYLAALNGADVLIFTGGIGENSSGIRARICEGLDNLGIAIDDRANTSSSREPRAIAGSRVAVWVVPTNEELMILRDTMRCAEAR